MYGWKKLSTGVVLSFLNGGLRGGRKRGRREGGHKGARDFPLPLRRHATVMLYSGATVATSECRLTASSDSVAAVLSSLGDANESFS